MTLPRIHIMRTRHEGARAWKVADVDRIRALCFTEEDAHVVARSLELAGDYFGRPTTPRRSQR